MTYLYAYLNNAAFTARSRMREEQGQTMAEYGVILAVITVLIVAALVLLSGGIKANIDRVTSVLGTVG